VKTGLCPALAYNLIINCPSTENKRAKTPGRKNFPGVFGIFHKRVAGRESTVFDQCTHQDEGQRYHAENQKGPYHRKSSFDRVSNKRLFFCALKIVDPKSVKPYLRSATLSVKGGIGVEILFVLGCLLVSALCTMARGVLNAVHPELRESERERKRAEREKHRQQWNDLWK